MYLFFSYYFSRFYIKWELELIFSFCAKFMQFHCLHWSNFLQLAVSEMSWRHKVTYFFQNSLAAASEQIWDFFFYGLMFLSRGLNLGLLRFIYNLSSHKGDVLQVQLVLYDLMTTPLDNCIFTHLFHG